MITLKQRIASITANIDDLQSVMEACLRAVDTLHADTIKLEGVVAGPLRRSVARHLSDVRGCAREHRAALRELRRSVANLRKDLQLRTQAVPPPPLAALVSRRSS